MLEQTSKSPGTKSSREKVDGIPLPPKFARANFKTTPPGQALGKVYGLRGTAKFARANFKAMRHEPALVKDQ